MSRGACEFGPGIVVCYATCWACKFDQCYETPTWHSWADLDDIEWARETGQSDPSDQRCACKCADGPREADRRARPYMDPDDVAEIDPQMSSEPCPECGEHGACAWDSEGRPLIHALGAEIDR